MDDHNFTPTHPSDWYARARREFDPNQQAQFFRLRDMALNLYRDRVKTAVDTYHDAVGATWRRFDYAPSSVGCAAAMNVTWAKFKTELQNAAAQYDMAPRRAYEAVKRGPTVTEIVCGV